MGSSYVEFRDKGFWTGDWTIELWERLLVVEIDKLSENPNWLQNFHDHLDVQAQGVGVGCNWVGLNDYITTEEQRQTLITLAKTALAAIEQYGEFIPKAVMESFPRHEGMGEWDADIETTNVKYLAAYFLKLLNGEYPLTASDWGGRIEHLQNEKVYDIWSHLVQQKISSS